MLGLLYSGNLHGWDIHQFHQRSDYQGRTLVLVRSTEGYDCAGYTSVPWTSGEQYVNDAEAFLLQLTGDLRKYQTLTPENAVLHARYAGPCFGFTLAVGAHDMGSLNGYLNGRCVTNALSNYNVGEDSQGRSVLTGSNSRDDQAR